MRAHQLLLALRDFLETSLADFPLPAQASAPPAPALGPIRCFLGNVPDDGPESLPARFPFVVIRWVQGQSDEHGEQLETVALILGVYSPAGPGEAELLCAALADHLRQAFLRARILARVFDLQLPLEAARPDPEKQQHQYHIATLVTRWGHRSPLRDL